MGTRCCLLILLLALALLAILSGCAGALTPPSDTGSTEQIPLPQPSTTEGAPVLPEREQAETPERLEPPEISPLAGEVPTEIQEEITADLVQRTGVAREDILVVKAEAVVWNDGSLGCPKPGEFYIQILVNGYWVVLQVEDVAYDYRASDSGGFTLCEKGGDLPIAPPVSSPSN